MTLQKQKTRLMRDGQLIKATVEFWGRRLCGVMQELDSLENEQTNDHYEKQVHRLFGRFIEIRKKIAAEDKEWNKWLLKRHTLELKFKDQLKKIKSKNKNKNQNKAKNKSKPQKQKLVKKSKKTSKKKQTC